MAGSCGQKRQPTDHRGLPPEKPQLNGTLCRFSDQNRPEVPPAPVRASPVGPPAPDAEARIVVLSNYDGSEDIHRALNAGAMAYLTKDADADELIAAILAVRKGRRYLPKALRALEAMNGVTRQVSDEEILEHRAMVASQTSGLKWKSRK